MAFTTPPVWTRGAVTQTSSATTDVTLNTQSGVITTFTGTQTTGVNNAFKLINSSIQADSVVLVSVSGQGGATNDGQLAVSGKALAAGEVTLQLYNPDTATLASNPRQLSFIVLDPVSPDLTTPPVLTSGTVSQGGSIAGTVELNTQCGVITTQSATAAKSAAQTFVFNNSEISANSVVLVWIQDYSGTYTTNGNNNNGYPTVSVDAVAAGSCAVMVSNIALNAGGQALSGTLKIGFLVL